MKSTLTESQKEIAALVARMKAGRPLTPSEQAQVEAYRQRAAAAEGDALLIRLCARTDLLLQPWRLPAEKQTPIVHRVVEYRQKGLRWHVGGDGEARKAGMLELFALEKAGAVIVHRQGKKATHVKLSPATYLDVRAKCGLPDVFQSLLVLSRMTSAFEAGCYVPADHTRLTDDSNQSAQQYIREFDLTESPILLPKSNPRPITEAEREALFQIQEQLTPAFFFGWAGWAIALSSPCVAYAATGSPSEAPDSIFKTKLPPLNTEWEEAYTQTWVAERKVLKVAAPLWPHDIGLFTFFVDFRTANECQQFPGTTPAKNQPAATTGTTAGQAGRRVSTWELSYKPLAK